MKHILIVDLADDSKCCGCPCLQTFGYCEAIPNCGIGGAEIIDDIRPNDCPLRPMPEKMEITDDDGWHKIDYKEGFNDCLDEILGENNVREIR